MIKTETAVPAPPVIATIPADLCVGEPLRDGLVPTLTLKVGDVYRQFAGGEPIVIRTIDRVGTCQTVVGMACRDGSYGTDWLGQFTRKVDTNSLPSCETCDRGCNCSRGTAGCQHFACWGVVDNATANTCPGALRQSVALHTRTAVSA